MWRTALVLLALGALLAPSGAVAAPASTTCTGVLFGGPYFAVEVPTGASCSLIEARVIGGVTAAAGSSLLIANNSTIVGGVVADHALWVQIIDSFVAGTVRIVGAGDDPSGVTEAAVRFSTIVGGDIEVEESAGTILVDDNRVRGGSITVARNYVPPFLAYPSELSVRLNHVSGDVTVSGNTGPGPKEVWGNEVLGTLRCEQNDSPFTGGPNEARTTIGACF